jgi:RNA polymerase sigma factor (sigma-70 family)
MWNFVVVMQRSRKRVEDGMACLSLYSRYSPSEVLRFLEPVSSSPETSSKVSSLVEGIGKEHVLGRVLYEFYRRDLEWKPLNSISYKFCVPQSRIVEVLKDKPHYGVRIFTGMQRYVICNPALVKELKLPVKKFSKNATASITKKLEAICEDGFIPLKDMESNGLDYLKLKPMLKHYEMNFRGDFLPRPIIVLRDNKGKRAELFNREYYNLVVKGFYGDLIIDNYPRPTKRFKISKLADGISSPIPKNQDLTLEEQLKVCNKFLTVSRKLRGIESKLGLSVVSIKKVAKLLDDGGYKYFSTGKGKLFTDSFMKDTLARISDLEKLANHFGTILLEDKNIKYLIINYAKKYVSRAKSLKFYDLMQEGRLGFIHALKKFNPAKGVKLTSYASWWIQQAMLRALVDKDKIVDVPVYINGLVTKTNAARDIFFAEKGHMPSDEELSEKLCISPKDVKKGLDAVNLRYTYSINRPVKGDSDDEFESFIFYDKDSDPEKDIITKLDKSVLANNLEKMLSLLSERESKILKMRSGIGCEEHTLEEIGNIFSLSKERVRQIEEKALDKLKRRKDEYRAAISDYL